MPPPISSHSPLQGPLGVNEVGHEDYKPPSSQVMIDSMSSQSDRGYGVPNWIKSICDWISEALTSFFTWVGLMAPTAPPNPTKIPTSSPTDPSMPRQDSLGGADFPTGSGDGSHIKPSAVAEGHEPITKNDSSTTNPSEFEKCKTPYEQLRYLIGILIGAPQEERKAKLQSVVPHLTPALKKHLASELNVSDDGLVDALSSDSKNTLQRTYTSLAQYQVSQMDKELSKVKPKADFFLVEKELSLLNRYVHPSFHSLDDVAATTQLIREQFESLILKHEFPYSLVFISFAVEDALNPSLMEEGGMTLYGVRCNDLNDKKLDAMAKSIVNTLRQKSKGFSLEYLQTIMDRAYLYSYEGTNQALCKLIDDMDKMRDEEIKSALGLLIRYSHIAEDIFKSAFMIDSGDRKWSKQTLSGRVEAFLKKYPKRTQLKTVLEGFLACFKQQVDSFQQLDALMGK